MSRERPPNSEVPISPEEEIATPENDSSSSEKIVVPEPTTSGVPSFDRFYNMNDEEYRNLISTQDVDTILPKTEVEQDLENTVEAIMDGVEEIMDQMDPDNPDFEQLLGGIGRLMDQHYTPFITKYKDRENEVINGLSSFVIRQKATIDKDRFITDPKSLETMSSPRSELEDIAQLVDITNREGDRIIKSELASGKSIDQIQDEYTSLSLNENANDEDRKRAPIILHAIKRLRNNQTQLAKSLSRKILGTGLPESIKVSLDGEDLEVELAVSKEVLEQQAEKEGSALTKNKEGSYILTTQGKTYEFIYDAKEEVYEYRQR